MCYVPKAAAEACVGRIIAVLEHHRRQIVCPRLWKSSLTKTCFSISAPTGTEITMPSISEHIWRECQCTISGIISFLKNETPFCQRASVKGLFCCFFFFFKKEKFSFLVQIFAVSMSSDSRQQSNELHTNQSQLFMVGQAAFKVRNEIASTESHVTRSWIGWLGGSFCNDWASGIPWP